MLAESFATVVALIGQYRAEQGSKSQLELKDFLEWLAHVHHDEIKSSLEVNTQATIYIKSLLNQDHRIFKEKLDKIDAALTAFASTLEGFDGLANELNPDATLSRQAINILEQFHEAKASKVLEIRMMGGTIYSFLDAQGQLEIIEPRFIEDDFYTLTQLRLLRHELSPTGDNIYAFTRAAHSLINNRNASSDK